MAEYNTTNNDTNNITNTNIIKNKITKIYDVESRIVVLTDLQQFFKKQNKISQNILDIMPISSNYLVDKIGFFGKKYYICVITNRFSKSQFSLKYHLQFKCATNDCYIKFKKDNLIMIYEAMNLKTDDLKSINEDNGCRSYRLSDLKDRIRLQMASPDILFIQPLETNYLILNDKNNNKNNKNNPMICQVNNIYNKSKFALIDHLRLTGNIDDCFLKLSPQDIIKLNNAYP